MNWDDPEVALSVQKTVIEQLRLGDMQTIADGVEVEIAQGYLANTFTAHLTTYVLVEKLLSEVQDVTWRVSQPTTSWQMFKQEHEKSWWLGWLVRRHPVKMKVLKHTETFSFDRYAMFPHASISRPDLGQPYIFEQTNLPNPRKRARVQAW